MELYRYVNRYGELVLRTFPILKETRSGCWIDTPPLPFPSDRKRFVNSHAKKRFAYPTKEEALVNFIARTERHIMLNASNLTTK